MASFLNQLFHDNNDINEKIILGFISFVVMFLFALADLISGIFGIDLVIHEYIYQSFLILTLGSFGIGSVDKFINKKFEDKPGISETTTIESTTTINEKPTEEFGSDEGFSNRNRME